MLHSPSLLPSLPVGKSYSRVCIILFTWIFVFLCYWHTLHLLLVSRLPKIIRLLAHLLLLFSITSFCRLSFGCCVKGSCFIWCLCSSSLPSQGNGGSSSLWDGVSWCVCLCEIFFCYFVVLCNFSLSSSFTSYCSHNCWSNSWLLCVWARFVSNEEGFVYEKKKGGRENLAIYVSFIFLYSCWLSVERNVIWAFIVPMLIIIIVCWYGA